MKIWRSSTMPRYRKIPVTTAVQRTVFTQIADMLQPYTSRSGLLLDVRINTPEHFELWTKHSFRSLSQNPKYKRGILFAGALIMKKCVGLYLYPLYINPALSDKIDEVLKPFWKGNSAFHFSEPLAEATLSTLARLLDEGWDYYRVNRWIF